MKRLIFFSLFLVIACRHSDSKRHKLISASDALIKPNQTDEVAYRLTDKSIKFVWRADKYNEQLKDTFSTIIINEDYCKTISEPERAALGYVSTFIGSECNWDGKAKADFSNLNCKIISALGLGYQCSEKHLGFLRRWFKNDNKVLEQLKECPLVPFTASSQNTFDQINLSTKGDTINVWYKASGENMKIGESWDWTEEDLFILFKDNLKLVKVTKSEVNRHKFDD